MSNRWQTNHLHSLSRTKPCKHQVTHHLDLFTLCTHTRLRQVHISERDTHLRGSLTRLCREVLPRPNVIDGQEPRLQTSGVTGEACLSVSPQQTIHVELDESVSATRVTVHQDTHVVLKQGHIRAQSVGDKRNHVLFYRAVGVCAWKVEHVGRDTPNACHILHSHPASLKRL